MLDPAGERLAYMRVNELGAQSSYLRPFPEATSCAWNETTRSAMSGARRSLRST